MAKRRKETWEKYLISFGSVEFRPYVNAIGQLTLAWNGLYLTMGMLFASVMGGGDVGQFYAVWNAISSDRNQRDALLAAVKSPSCHASVDFPKLVDEVAWICGQASHLEDLRNDCLHSPLAGIKYGPGHQAMIMPAVSTGHKRAKKLFDKNNLLKDYRYCRDSSIILRSHVYDIYRALSEKSSPWPDTPKLPNRGDKKQSQDRPKSAAKHSRQRQPSQE